MKNGIFFLICIFCAAVNLPAQQLFNVQNGSKANFYADLETAIQQAVSGDTIYLPGRPIQVQNNLVIDKRLTIIGAGWDMDSIGGISISDIKLPNGSYVSINFREGSDGSLITGCYIGPITFGYTDGSGTHDNISNVTIWRNRISGGSIITLSAQVTQIFISENLLGNYIDGKNASNCIINNNLGAYVTYFVNTLIYNNIFNNNFCVINSSGCTVENNFCTGTSISGCSNSYFNNNAFQGNITFPNGTNEGSNNLVNQSLMYTFVVNDFSAPKNLVIRDDSPCKNAGSDGTDIGIYGGTTPYKPGAVPYNPHINRVDISGHTDKDGNIKVNIQASAQTR